MGCSKILPVGFGQCTNCYKLRHHQSINCLPSFIHILLFCELAVVHAPLKSPSNKKLAQMALNVLNLKACLVSPRTPFGQKQTPKTEILKPNQLKFGSTISRPENKWSILQDHTSTCSSSSLSHLGHYNATTNVIACFSMLSSFSLRGIFVHKLRISFFFYFHL